MKENKTKTVSVRCIKCKQKTVKRSLTLKDNHVLMSITKCTNCDYQMSLDEYEEENHIKN